MNIFEELSAWYAEPTHSWGQLHYFKKDKYDGSEKACLIGGLTHVKFGSNVYLLSGIKIRREQKVLRQAIFEVTGRKTRSITRYNDCFASYDSIQLVLQRAAQIWDERYPDEEKPQQFLHTAPFSVDFSEMVEESNVRPTAAHEKERTSR